MDESRYQHLADAVFRRVVDAFDAIDPEDADVETAGDTVRISFRSGKKIVLNTQRPVRQIWMAGGARAWHFSYDEATGVWRDDKGGSSELFATLAALTRGEGGVELTLP